MNATIARNDRRISVTMPACCSLIQPSVAPDTVAALGRYKRRTVWKSAELPPMVVAAFPAAPEAERSRFQEHLTNLCDNEGQSACAEVGIVSLKAASATRIMQRSSPHTGNSGP
jgi:hypothetical protein